MGGPLARWVGSQTLHGGADNGKPKSLCNVCNVRLDRDRSSGQELARLLKFSQIAFFFGKELPANFGGYSIYSEMYAKQS